MLKETFEGRGQEARAEKWVSIAGTCWLLKCPCTDCAGRKALQNTQVMESISLQLLVLYSASLGTDLRQNCRVCLCVCGHEKQNPHSFPSLSPIQLYRAPLHIAIWYSRRRQNRNILVIFHISVFPFWKIFYYKDMSDESTIIFRVIQCVIVEEKTVITFKLNLWPYTVLHCIAYSNIMVFPGLCFSYLAIIHMGLTLVFHRHRFSSVSQTHHPETLICSLTCWKLLIQQLRQISLC